MHYSNATSLGRTFEYLIGCVWNEGFVNTVFACVADLSWFVDYPFNKHMTYSCRCVKKIKIVPHTAHRLSSWTAEYSFSCRFLIFNEKIPVGTFGSGFIQKIVLQHKAVQNKIFSCFDTSRDSTAVCAIHAGVLQFCWVSDVAGWVQWHASLGNCGVLPNML